MAFTSGFARGAARRMMLLCALTAALHGCSSVGASTSALAPAPTTPGAIVTDGWAYEHAGEWHMEHGEWIHLPASEGRNFCLDRAGGGGMQVEAVQISTALDWAIRLIGGLVALNLGTSSTSSSP